MISQVGTVRGGLPCSGAKVCSRTGGSGRVSVKKTGLISWEKEAVSEHSGGPSYEDLGAAGEVDAYLVKEHGVSNARFSRQHIAYSFHDPKMDPE